MNVKISHTALGNISVLLFFSFGCKPDVGHKSDSGGGRPCVPYLELQNA